MQSDKSCPIFEQYLAYLLTIKGRSRNTNFKYEMDLLQFFRYIIDQRKIIEAGFDFVDTDFIRSIQLYDMYGLIAYHQELFHNSAGTRCQKLYQYGNFEST